MNYNGSGMSYRAYIEARYNVTFATSNLDARQELGTVFFSSGENGNLKADYSGAHRDLNSGGSVTYGDSIQFTATPNEGYYVESWNINGTFYSIDNPESLEELSTRGMSLQKIDKTYEILRVTSFSESNTQNQHVEGQTEETVKCLQVSVKFSNQKATVEFSASGGGGEITAVAGGTGIENGSSVNYGASITFTAEPGDGKMVKSWSVQYGEEAAQIYKWPDGGAYTENTLTLEDIQGDVKVEVTFTDKVSVAVTATMVDADKPDEGSVAVGTLSVKNASGSSLGTSQDTLSLPDAGGTLVFGVEIDSPALNAVREWQYKENGEGNWQTAANSGSKTEWTYHIPTDGTVNKLEVRVLIERAQTYTLNWEVEVPEGKNAGDIATLTAKVGDVNITSGQDCTAHIAPVFTVEIKDKDYYVVDWENATPDSSDNRKATLTALTGNTTVTVTVAEKPKVQLPTGLTGGEVTVTGTYYGKSVEFPHNGGSGTGNNLHYDPNTDIVITAKPNDDYYVDTIQSEAQTPALHGDKSKTLKNQTANVEVQATFKEKPKLVWSGTDDGHGTVEVTGTYKNGTVTWTFPSTGSQNLHFDPGTDLTVTATPDNDYYVTKVQDVEQLPAAFGAKTVKLSAQSNNANVSAEFKEKPKLTWNVNGEGEGTVEVKGQYEGVDTTWTFPTNKDQTIHVDPNTTLTVTAKPSDDYYVNKLQNEQQEVSHGNKTKENVTVATENVDISVEFAEKPVIMMPSATEGGTITVKRTLCGKEDSLTAPTDMDLHYDPGTGLTVTMEPSMGYVPQKGGADLEVPGNSDNYSETFNGIDVEAGCDLSGYSFRKLASVTVNLLVIGEGGYNTGGPAHGTLTGTTARKGMERYASTATSGKGSDGNDQYDYESIKTLTVYEGGTITLTAAGDPNTEHTHSVAFWSTDQAGSYQQHVMTGGREYLASTYSVDYADLAKIARDGSVYIGVSFAQSNARISFGMRREDQQELAEVTATMKETGESIGNGNAIGENNEVTFTVQIFDPNYEVKQWYVDGKAVPALTEETIEQKAGVGNLVVEVELRGKKLENFSVQSGGNGEVSYEPVQEGADAVRYKEGVALTATPEPGYEFEGWYYDDVKIDSAAASYTVAEPENGVYTAKFTPIKGLSVAFAVAPADGGTITAAANGTTFESGEAKLEGGQEIVLQLELEDGWQLTSWVNLPEGATQSDDKLTVTIPKLTGNIIMPITANVEAIPMHTVTVTIPDQAKDSIKITAMADGVQQPDSPFKVREGTTVTFQREYITGGPSITFGSWMVNGEDKGNDDSLTLTITADTVVTFTNNIGLMHALTLTLRDNDNSTAEIRVQNIDTSYGPGTNQFASGSAVTITAKPGTNQMVKAWYIDDVIRKTESGRTLLELALPEFTLDKDTTVTVVFETKAEHPYPAGEESVYTVENVTSYPGGENSGVSENHYREGGDLSFTIKPNDEIGEDLLMPYIDGFKSMGDEVAITENENGGWNVEIKGVKDEVEMPALRVKMTEGIPDTAVPDTLKTPAALEQMKDYLPEGATDITGEVLTEVMERIVVDKMPTAPDANKSVYDVELQKYENGAWVPVTDESEFPDGGLTVILPYPEGTNSNDTFTVVHMFTTGTAAGTTETFTADSADHTLTNTSMGLRFHVSSLSPIAVAWTKYVAPNPPAGGGGGVAGGGGTAAEENPVTLPKNVSNGSVSADKETAREGAEVTLTVTPDWGYIPETVTVTDENGETVELKDNGDGTYTFTMPATGVMVSVTFGSTCGRDESCPMYGFADAVRTAWYHDGVHYCLEKGLMDGVGGGRFAPDLTTTRAMLVTILYRLDGKPAVSKNIPFEDVPAGQWYSDAIIWAAANGIVKGYNDTEFGPMDTVTREQMAAILYRYSEYKKYDVTATSDLAGYKDADTVNGWGDAAMRWAVAEGLIEGTTKTTLAPGSGSTRAMVATVLMRYCEKIAK